LHELVPRADSIAFLVNPNNAVASLDTSDAQAAAETLGKKLIIFEAGTKDELDKTFAAFVEQHGRALVRQADPFFLGQRDQIVALAAHHAIPAIYYLKDYPAAGGLMSYGTLADALRLVGNYTGRILKGEKPRDLPVQQSVRTEFVTPKTNKPFDIALAGMARAHAVAAVIEEPADQQTLGSGPFGVVIVPVHSAWPGPRQTGSYREWQAAPL
jgi:ABC-type uncharacterized transport system substrate-binding protein